MNNKVFNVLDSPSFLKGYKEIYIDGIYDFKQSSINSSSPFIIDCGSNIGLSIAYFKSIYPGSKIIGVEADKHIFEILSENVNHYRYVSLINGAISSYKGQLAFLSNGSDGGRIIQNKDEKSFLVQSVDLDTLIQPETDLLKIDIEGAETDVILNKTSGIGVLPTFIQWNLHG